MRLYVSQKFPFSAMVPVGGCMYAGVASAHGVAMDTLIKLENAQVPTNLKYTSSHAIYR